MRYYLSLFRIKVSLMVGLSAFAGACLYDDALSLNHAYAVLSAVFLSAGCSALNQFQEREQDRLMKRTEHRPLPAGVMRPKEVLQISALLIALSASFMVLTGSYGGLIVIAAVAAVYNLVYTPLKKITPFALLAGSVTGAIPPLMGYVAMGGRNFSAEIILICAVLYVWQTPHFAMLSERYAEDYSRAGFKTLSGSYGRAKAGVFIKIWLAAYICSLLVIPLSGIYCFHVSSVIHTAGTAVTALLLLLNIRKSSASFHTLNLSMVFFFLLLVVDRIII